MVKITRPAWDINKENVPPVRLVMLAIYPERDETVVLSKQLLLKMYRHMKLSSSF